MCKSLLPLKLLAMQMIGHYCAKRNLYFLPPLPPFKNVSAWPELNLYVQTLSCNMAAHILHTIPLRFDLIIMGIGRRARWGRVPPPGFWHTILTMLVQQALVLRKHFNAHRSSYKFFPTLRCTGGLITNRGGPEQCVQSFLLHENPLKFSKK